MSNLCFEESAKEINSFLFCQEYSADEFEMAVIGLSNIVGTLQCEVKKLQGDVEKLKKEKGE